MGTIPAYHNYQQEAGIFRGPRRAPLFAWLLALLACAGLGLSSTASRAQTPLAQDVGGQKLKLAQPLDGATVRESVPVRMSRSILPTGGYVAIIIDGVFRTAQEVPASGGQLYDWDTKGSFTTPDNPDQPQYTQDGPHDIQVEVFDHDGTLVGVAEAHVRVANKINALPDGVKLVYNWRLDQIQRYQYSATLSNDQSDNGGAKQAIQDATLKFDRSVEDATGGQYLIRDLILPNGFLTSGATPQLIQTAYDLKSRYRTVNSFGEILVNNVAFSPGDHFGFPIPQFPGRRVNVGDSWQSHMEVALGWNSVRPTMITGTAKLDSFEWQNGYPTAKIIETYDGPALFHLNQEQAAEAQDASNSSPNAANDQNAIKPVNASDVHITRTIWFAYNSGQLIRVETDMTVNANMSSAQVADLGQAGQGGGVFMGGGAGREDGMPNINMEDRGSPGGPPPGYMGMGGPPPGFNPGMMMGGKGPGMMFGPGGPGAFGPGGYRPPIAGNAAAQAQPTSPTKLDLHSVTSLLGVR